MLNPFFISLLAFSSAFSSPAVIELYTLFMSRKFEESEVEPLAFTGPLLSNQVLSGSEQAGISVGLKRGADSPFIKTPSPDITTAEKISGFLSSLSFLAYFSASLMPVPSTPLFKPLPEKKFPSLEAMRQAVGGAAYSCLVSVSSTLNFPAEGPTS